jgi:hypothetical protein
MNVPPATRQWLLAAPEPYIRYQVLRLLEPERADTGLLDEDPFIGETIRGLADWREDTLTRHDKPGHFLHRLAMLADLGVTARTDGAGPLVKQLLTNIRSDGSFPIRIMLPTVFGGSGEAEENWLICDFPLVVYTLLQMTGLTAELQRSLELLASLAGHEHYTCGGSIPRFKGPGLRGEVCPYANLLAARAFAAHPDYAGSPPALLAARTVLNQWDTRRERKPFLFAMGTDFLKLKFPLVWYNVLHVLVGLSGVTGIPQDPRYRQMLGHLRAKLDAEGRVKPESIYMIYKGQEWSRKKEPSRLLTVMVHQLLAEAETAR